MDIDLIACATEMPTAQAFEVAVLESLAEAVGMDAAFFGSVCRKGPPSVLNLDASALDQPRAGIYARELAPVMQAALSRRGVAVDTEVLGISRVRSSHYFRELAAPKGGHHSLLAYLRLRGINLGVLMLGRCKRSFRNAEVQRVERMLPALSLACASFQVAAPAVTPATLTPREREVLEYVRLGYRNPEIALACGTSPYTVRNQLASIFQKLGATTRTEAVMLSRS